jgi:signal peptide peptidase SppA
MNILQRVFTDVPMIDSSAFAALLMTGERQQLALDPKMAEPGYYQSIRKHLRPQMSVDRDGIATIPIHGPMAWNPDVFDMLFYGVEDTRSVLSLIEEANADLTISGMLLDFDSPGGMMVGGFEVADAIKNSPKASVAWSGGWMTSLAYLMGSQADKIVTTRTAQIGSIGVMTTFTDITKMLEARGVKVEMFTNKEGTLKGAGTLGVALTDAQKEHIQARMDKGFAEFKRQVTTRRPGIPSDAMKGQAVYGSDARAMNLSDAIGSMKDAKDLLRALIGARR